MEMFLVALSLILTAAATASGLYFARKRAGGVTTESVLELRAEAQELESKIAALLVDEQTPFSRAQLETLIAETEEFQRGLDSQRALMGELEGRLTQTQKQVEEKEREQQEMKSAKEEDEAALQALMSKYHEYSTHAVALEHRLAESLKALDAMIVEMPMTADQKAVFQAMSDALSAASSRLRDLIIDYQSLNERLENLKDQHADLENEYTKLVEQQLGA